MKYYAKARNEFTAYMKAVIRHSATDYKRKVIKSIEREISVADFTSVPELLSHDDSSFLFAEEKDITYANIEKLFVNEKYYRAMKRLSGREKLVLFLTIVEEKRAEQVAEIMNTTKENIKMIKSRAIKHFLNNLTNGK
jgi:RNA polymerase sigma factor (sigma-70 family)